MLAARPDDDDDDIYVYIYIYIYKGIAKNDFCLVLYFDSRSLIEGNFY